MARKCEEEVRSTCRGETDSTRLLGDKMARAENPAHLPLTGIVVTFNEGRHLRQCLERLDFCDETVVVDLGSTDDSLEVAAQMNARIVHHPWVAVVEEVRSFAVAQASTDWVVFMDPDQLLPESIHPKLVETVRRNARAAIVGIDMRNYFKGKPLRHGRWGSILCHPVMMNKHAVVLSPFVHQGVTPRPGYEWIALGGGDENTIVHYWADSWGQLLRKARRYLREEGAARHHQGRRTNWARAAFAAGRMLWRSLVVRRGFMDGFDGVLLSFLSAWYEWNAHVSLIRYQANERAKRT